MSESFYISLGNKGPLSVTLPDGASGLFPRSRVYDSSETEVSGSPFDLSEVGSTGRYTDGTWVPSAVGEYTAHHIIYTDAGHTTKSPKYAEDQDSYIVKDIEGTVELSATFTGAEYRALAWLIREGKRVTTGLTGATLSLLDPQGVVVFGPVAMTAEANGTFTHAETPLTLTDNVNYYALVSITDAAGTETELVATPVVA